MAADFGSQNEAFGAGINHVINTAPHVNGGSLTNASARGNSAAGHDMLTSHSTLDPLAYSDSQSANGTSGQNFVPGMGVIGTGNGMSGDTFDQNQQLRYQGGDDDAELD
jgi:hypothetical protein